MKNFVYLHFLHCNNFLMTIKHISSQNSHYNTVSGCFTFTVFLFKSVQIKETTSTTKMYKFI